VGELRNVEKLVAGENPIALAEDLLAIPVPGHTAGSMALLYRERFLFTGDHLWWSEDRRRLVASRSVCWYSWPDQVRSLEKLRGFRFEWVLPGYGRRFQAASPEAMQRELERLLRFIGAPAPDAPKNRGADIKGVRLTFSFANLCGERTAVDGSGQRPRIPWLG
jgi:glyoxylase-like metal-dependent hydrolase (beta-lactamase superfamily II)